MSHTSAELSLTDSEKPGGLPSRFADTGRPSTELDDLLALLWRKRRQVALGLIASVVAGFIATRLETPLYLSTVLLQVAPEAVNATPYRDPFDAMTGKGNYESYLRTEEELLKSATLRERVVEELERGNYPALAAEIPMLRQRFSVARVEGSQLFRLGYTGESAESAAAIVNIFGQQLIEEETRKKRRARERVIALLREELDSLETRLAASRRELVDYARRNQIIGAKDASYGSEPVQARLLAVEQHLLEADASRIGAKSNLDRLRLGVAGSSVEQTTPSAQQLSSRLITLENDLSSLRTTFGDRWPAVVAKQSEIDFVQRQLTREYENARSSAVADAQLEFEIAESRHKMLSELVDQQRQAVGRYQRASIQYGMLQKEVETNEELYAGLLGRLKQGTLMSEMDSPNIQIVEHGRPNPVPDSPNLPVNLAVSLVMGLGLSIGVVLVNSRWDQSIRTTQQIEEVLHLPSLGPIPQTAKSALQPPKEALGLVGSPDVRLLGDNPAETNAPKATEGEPAAGEEPTLREFVISVCTSILLSQSGRPLQVIVVTSAIPSEGKTTVTWLLGKALASTGAKTLLIDADMRTATLSEQFPAATKCSLSLLLSGHAEGLEARASTVPNLNVLPAGPKPPNSAALLNSDAMTALLEKARSEYRYIVIDTPPIVGIADARVLSSRSDGVVLTARAGKVKRETVARAWSLVESSGGRGLGVVLNGTDAKDFDYAENFAKYYQ